MHSVAAMLAAFHVTARTMQNAIVLPDEAPSNDDDDDGTAAPSTMPLLMADNASGPAGGPVFVKAAHAQLVTATANGEKFFECSTKANMFKKLK